MSFGFIWNRVDHPGQHRTVLDRRHKDTPSARLRLDIYAWQIPKMIKISTYLLSPLTCRVFEFWINDVNVMIWFVKYFLPVGGVGKLLIMFSSDTLLN